MRARLISCCCPQLGALRKDELYRRLNRIIFRFEYRDRSERPVLSARVPALGVARLALSLDHRRAHHRREHVPGAPAPHFVAREILDDEIVRLSTGKTQLEHLAGVVSDVESEPKLVRVVVRSRYIEFGDDGGATRCVVAQV